SVGDNYEVKVYNLYVIMLEYLEKRGFTEKAIKMEERRGLQKLVESIGRLLKMDLPEEENVFFEYVDAHTPEKSVVFLTGIGELYPLIRAHSILNKMHQVFDRVPVV
ncbi:TPA: BREX protein BrxB domain-containing protein, partial [Enterococcus faecium]